MSIDLGSMFASLLLQDAEFNRNLDRAGRNVKSFSSKSNRYLAKAEQQWLEVERAADKFRKQTLSVDAALGALSIGGLAYATKATLANTAELKKNADMAGVSVKAYQELSYAGQQYQITQDALTDGLKELNLRAEEFAVTGAGPGKEAFERLGYSQEELNEKLKDTPALLLEIVDRLQGMGKAAQIRISDEIFGGQGGEQFVTLIKAGSGAIKGLTVEAHKMGRVLSEEAAAKAQEADKAINNLTEQIRNQFAVVVSELAPDIEAVAEDMATWVSNNREFLTQDIPGHIRDMVGEIKGFVGSSEYKAIMEYWELAAGAAIGWNIGKVGGVKAGALGALIGAGAGGWISVYRDLTEDHRTELKKLEDEYETLGLKIKETEELGTAHMKRSIPLWQERRAEIEKQVKALVETAKAEAEAAGSTNELSGAVKDLNNNLYDTDWGAWTDGLKEMTQEEKNAAESLKNIRADMALDSFFGDIDDHVDAIQTGTTAEMIAAETAAQFWKEAHQEAYDLRMKLAEISYDEISEAEKSLADVQIEEQTRAADEVDHLWEDTLSDIQRNFATMITDELEGTLEDFTDDAIGVDDSERSGNMLDRHDSRFEQWENGGCEESKAA